MERYKIIWRDAYIGILVKRKGKWFLEGNIRYFNTLRDLENYYKGSIKSITKL